MGDLGVLAAFVIARLCGHLWSRCLRQDVVRCLGVERMLIVRSVDFFTGFFQPLKSAFFSRRFFLGASFQKFRGMVNVIGFFFVTRVEPNGGDPNLLKAV